MPAFTINIPIRSTDSSDVKNAFAKLYGYSETIEVGGITVPNPISKQDFVKQKCINFMLEVTKSHLIEVEKIEANLLAQEIVDNRTQEVVSWFDDRRLESLGGISVYQNFPVVNDLNLSTDKNVAVNFSLSGIDPDNLPLTFSITKNPIHGSVLGTSPNFIYVPHNRYYGSDTFKFKANNGVKNSLEGTVHVNINRTITSVDAYYVLRRNQPLSFSVTSVDGIGDLSYFIVDNPMHGVLSGNNPFDYLPNQDFEGLDTLTFNTLEGQNVGTLGTVTIDVTNIKVNEQVFEMSKNTSLAFEPNSLNNIGTIIINVLSLPTNGTLTIDNNVYSYTPNADFIGSDFFSVTMTDMYDTSDVGIFTFNVQDN